ncbi:MAG: YafY family transcriptional regulator [Peptococcaceae bacterium]|jgi:predicted DNA-binding transcriptional regulator YafY|nr:YafY family transcriptional regulator [Peptococcaceae bacterium]
MQINRLFEIVYLLMDKKSVTANELAAHFEVSKRTILRDIDALTTAGIPVYTTQGKGGGISLHERFVLNKTVISESEQQQILFALQGMSATLYIEADSILSRLRSLFNKTDRDWIEVDFSRWGFSAPDRTIFDSLKNSIINEQAISFAYASSFREIADRKAYPLKLVFKSKSWYLQAFCLLENGYRTFKISRMRNVVMLSDSFDYKAFQTPDIEPFEYLSPELIKVKLNFEPRAAYRVYDEFDEQYITKNNDGSFTITMDLPDDSWLYDYILSFGAAIEVIEPKHVRDEILRQADKIKSKYISKT